MNPIHSEELTGVASLHSAGYDDGFTPLVSFGSGRDGATTSDSYTNILGDNITVRFTANNLFPDGTFSLLLESQLNDDGDQIDVLIRDVINDDTYAEDIDADPGSGTSDYTLGAISVTPTDPNTMVAIRIQIHNNDNSTEVKMIQPNLYFGVEP